MNTRTVKRDCLVFLLAMAFTAWGVAADTKQSQNTVAAAETNNAETAWQELQTALRPPPPPATIEMAVVVVATLPILLVYPFLQKYFTRGVLTGAIKG